MKNIKFFTLLLLVLIVSSCNNDDDNNSKSINGTWYLTKIEAPDTGTREDFGKGSVVWKINQSSMEVITIDTRMHVMTPEPTSMYSFPNGTYTYEVKSWGDTCDNSFNIEEYNFGCIILKGKTLTLTTEAVDGNRFTFTR
jgi:hypothetical protein